MRNPFQKSETGRSEEFKTILRLYGDLAYRMAFQVTGGRHAEACDLVQEVFIKIWNQSTEHRPTSMRGWMYRVLQNLFLDAARHKARYPTVSLDGSEGSEQSWGDAVPDGQPAMDQSLEKADLQKAVADALARLDVEFRIPVILCDMEGLAYEDIARILACPIGTVRSRIHRGRLQLKNALQSIQTLEVIS